MLPSAGAFGSSQIFGAAGGFAALGDPWRMRPSVANGESGVGGAEAGAVVVVGAGAELDGEAQTLGSAVFHIGTMKSTLITR
jgi:hypothetical protein